MTIDMTAAIDILGETAIITVTRRVAPTEVDGDLIPDPAPTVFTADALIAPASGKDLERLPEGDRTAGIMVCKTKIVLRGVRMADGTPADEIAFQSDDYEIITEADWQTQASVHNCLIRKVDPT